MFHSMSTIIGYSMPNPLHTFILNIYDLVWFYGIPNLVFNAKSSLFINIKDIDLVWLCFIAYQPLWAI